MAAASRLSLVALECFVGVGLACLPKMLLYPLANLECYASGPRVVGNYSVKFREDCLFPKFPVLMHHDERRPDDSPCGGVSQCVGEVGQRRLPVLR